MTDAAIDDVRYTADSSSLSGKSSDEHGSEGSSRSASPAVLPIYLREMSSVPLLEKSEEVDLAKQLSESRAEIAKLLQNLDPTWRQQIGLEDGRDLADHADSTLEEVNTLYDRAVALAKSVGGTDLVEFARASRDAKRRLDAARERLITSNLRLVVHIAKQYVKNGLPLMDLIQEGNLGLMKAVEKFEHKRGTRFSTYAYWWIKQSIDRSISDKGTVIRIPVHVNEKRKKLRRTVRELRRQLGRRPTEREIAQRLGTPIEKVREVLDVVKEPQSLDLQDDGNSPIDTLADPESLSPINRVEENETRSKIEQSLKTLEPREEEIIRLRFGIGRDELTTLEQIGRRLHLSRERIRQLEASALRKLQGTQVLLSLSQQ
jgi:RNA polymerase primary sigma factor